MAREAGKQWKLVSDRGDFLVILPFEHAVFV
jgi:hypothetical protein